jgi:hypothetical protein
MNKPIATVHWIDVDGEERSIHFFTDDGLKGFIQSLKFGKVCYWTCLSGGSVPFNTPKRLAEIVS